MISFLQYILPQHLLSRLMGFFAELEQSWIKNFFINQFIKRYHVNMNEAIHDNALAYRNFNDFFTRELKPHVRTVVQDVNAITSPVDGAISQMGDSQAGRIFQAKGFDFTINELLGGKPERAQPFMGGKFITLYLSPKDYHRIHMPIRGKLKEMVYIPGKLFSVNSSSVNTIPRLFARNERVIALFDTEVGPMAIIMVGAMIVASINTVWHGDINADRKNQIIAWEYTDDKIYERGDEIGHFKLGSTVLVLFGPNAIAWKNDLQADSVIQLGQLVGMIKE
ncbi:MAG: Phosphatidylserine decarboxylase proenzyme [Legionellaceae bacterium]